MADRDARDDDALRGYLAERDVACPLCGYNLRGLTTPRCPECNKEVELRVVAAESPESRSIERLGGLAGLMLGALLCLVMLAQLIWVRHTSPSSWAPAYASLVILMALILVLSLIGLVLWVQLQDRVQRLPVRSRRWLAVACWAAPAAAFAAFFLVGD